MSKRFVIHMRSPKLEPAPWVRKDPGIFSQRREKQMHNKLMQDAKMAVFKNHMIPTLAGGGGG